ncbi:MAG TPA: alanine racemase [Deltaproteobacteria bacterium]|nr:alanine racemase [Deltaproteobacteria bacterium]HCP44746.1 alanine racemase [Deltaproteobacteria bacterium]
MTGWLLMSVQSPAVPSSPARFRPTVARIDLSAIRHNCRVVRSHLPSPDTSILVAVKAGAYGHGLLEVSRVLEDEGVDWLGVALVEEGLVLRNGGLQLPILVLGGLMDGSEDAALGAGLSPVVYRAESARRLDAAGMRQGRKVPVHIKVDTGMGRLGVPVRDLASFLDGLGELPHIEVDGVLTHLAEAENPQDQFTQGQLQAFSSAVDTIRARGHRPSWVHAANSAALMAGRHPDESTGANLVRPGISIYGHPPDPALAGHWPLRSAMSLETVILYLKSIPKGHCISYGLTWRAERDTVVATVPVGYGDGYARGLGNQAHALVGGRRVPVVGRVCMDLTLLDVTDVPGVAQGDPVVLVGTQGDEQVTVSELADLLGTIPYEVLCAISPRVPRVHHDSELANRAE